MKIFNLLLVLAVGLFFSSTTVAANPDPDFTEEKNREISRVKERIQISEERLRCLQNAKDFEALKSCNQAADKKMDALEAKIKAHAHDKKTTPGAKHQDNKHPDTKNKQN